MRNDSLCFKILTSALIAGSHYKMRALLVLAAYILAVTWGGEVNSIEDLDIEALLKNDEQRQAAYACLMDKGPCGEMQKLRDSLPLLVETRCSQCTPKQKEKFEQINKILFLKYPKEYQDLVLKYSSTAS